MRTFSRSFYCFLIHIQTFFNDYDVTTLEIIHPITFQNYTKHLIKVLRKKMTSCKHATFLLNGSRTPSECFCAEFI